MFKTIKIVFLYTVKYLGGFWLSRYLNKGNACVLCYHGFAYDDEYLFRPKLFMRPETFAQRLEWLEKSSYEVISLQDAVSTNKSSANYIALTMDDGWAATYELVGDTLAKHNFPLMLYVTTYYAEKQIAVINVALSYLLWKSQSDLLKIDEPLLSLKKVYDLSKDNHTDIVNELCQHIDMLPNVEHRFDILKSIAKQLQVSLTKNERLLFRLLNGEELRQLSKNNVDHQLHTHRHCSPKEEAAFKQEIEQNISGLERLCDKKLLDQFCYPSGEYYPQQLPWLNELGIKTATTISAGMLTNETDLLQIPRFLDGEDVHQIEFEAELCGFTSFLRRFL